MTSPRPDRADVTPARPHLEVAAALIAEQYTESRGFTEAPKRWHEYLHAFLLDRLEGAVLDECPEAPDEWSYEERREQAIARVGAREAGC